MTAYSERVRDLPFLQWCKRQRCVLERLGDCEGVVEADHVGDRGLSHKSLDCAAICACTKHHRDRTDSRGFFALSNWGGDVMLRRAFVVGQMVLTQWRYLTEGHTFLEDAAPTRRGEFLQPLEAIPW